MTYSREKLREELVRDEGFRTRTYRCTAGKLSIGVGRNLDDIGIRPNETLALGITKASVIKNGITRAQAMALLDSDIDVVEAQLDHHLPWWRGMSDARQRVILNMCFNMGIGTLLKFKNTLRFMSQGKYNQAARNMGMSLWARQVGKRAKRLQDMMRVG